MRFNAQSLGNVLDAFGMGSRTNMEELSPHFEGGFFNRESFNTANAALDEAGKKQAGDLGDALDFAFGRNSKEYTQEALNNAGEAYRKNGQVGLGNFATPTHSSSFLMERFGDTAMGAAFGGAAIGGIAGAAMGNDPGESSVYGGLAGIAMAGIGRGLRSPAFMEAMEKKAISSIMGKSHDELVAGKQAVYREAVDEGLGVERINAQKADTDRLVNESRQSQLDAIGNRGGMTKEELLQRREMQPIPAKLEQIDRQLSEISDNEIVGIDRRTNQSVTRQQLNSMPDEERIAVKSFDETSMSKEEYIESQSSSAYPLSREEREIYSKTMDNVDQGNLKLNPNPQTEIPPLPLGEIKRTNFGENFSPEEKLGFEFREDNTYSDYINADVSEADYQRYMATKDQTLQGGPNEERVLSVRGEGQKPGEVTLNPNHPQNFPSMKEKQRTARNKLAYQEMKDFEKERDIQVEAFNDAKKRGLTSEQHEAEIAALLKQNSKEVGFKRADRKIANQEPPSPRSKLGAAQQQYQEASEYVDKKQQAISKATQDGNYPPLDKHSHIYNQTIDTIEKNAKESLKDNYKFTRQANIDARRAQTKQEALREKLIEENQQKIGLDEQDKTIVEEELVRDNTSVIRSDIRKDMYNAQVRKYEDLSKAEQLQFKNKTDEVLAGEGNLSDNFDYAKKYNENLYNPKEKLNEVYGAEYDKVVESQKASKQKQAELQKQKEELRENFYSQKSDPFAVKKETATPVTSQTDPSKIESGKMNVFNLDNAFYQTGEGVLSMRPNELKNFPLDKSQRLVSQTNSNIFGERMISPQTPFSPRTQDLLQKTSSTNASDLNANFAERTVPLANKELLQEAVATPTTSFMGKQAQKLLRSGPDHNVGMQTRHMVLGGSMLAGAAFGSKRKDHSRGFNSHRGNRI